MSDFESAWDGYRLRTERSLTARLPNSEDSPERLHQAMHYVCLNGGKRVRAMLVYACGEIAGSSLPQLDVPASAVEMIHAYSLTHDDLPAMDDDDLRRGRPTCHIAFDEATAVLTGDALQSLAFEVLSSDPALNVSAPRRLEMIETLAAASGAAGMAGGQALDMRATGRSVDFDHLVEIHKLKTGALIRAAVKLGGLASERGDDDYLGHLDRYGANLGLAFQIVDDILDQTSDSQTLGKQGGADKRMQKTTYVSVLGMDRARSEARELCENALETADLLGDNSTFLKQLAQFVVTRSY